MNKHLINLLIIPTTALFSQNNWDNYKVSILSQFNTLSFWSPPQKVGLIMDYVALAKPQLCVEIGSFQGAISFAIGNTLAFNQKGILHTIDKWQYTPDESKKSEYNQFANFWYAIDTDGDLLYLDFLARHFQGNLRNYIHPLRIESLKAVKLFSDDSIDMLFLDGDFSQEYALNELIQYFPKVKKGGGIWLNRADLESKHLLVKYLMETCQHQNSWSYGIECVLFTKK